MIKNDKKIFQLLYFDRKDCCFAETGFSGNNENLIYGKPSKKVYYQIDFDKSLDKPPDELNKDSGDVYPLILDDEGEIRAAIPISWSQGVLRDDE